MAPGADHSLTEALMIGRALGCVVVCGCLMAGASLQAHHSLAGVYDMKGEKEIAGTLTQIKFVNPHGSLTITVKNPDGTATDWVFTTGSATTLADRGITKVGPEARKAAAAAALPCTPLPPVRRTSRPSCSTGPGTRACCGAVRNTTYSCRSNIRARAPCRWTDSPAM